MDTVIALFVLLLLVGGVVLICIGIAAFALALLLPRKSGAVSTASDDIDGMNEGDYHNGPGGYQPQSAYWQSHYGHHDEDEEA